MIRPDLPSSIDPDLWVEDAAGTRGYVTEGTAAARGRFHVYWPEHDRSLGTFVEDLSRVSVAAFYWLNGFLEASTESFPAEHEDDEVRMRQWLLRNIHLRRHGQAWDAESGGCAVCGRPVIGGEIRCVEHLWTDDAEWRGFPRDRPGWPVVASDDAT